ncbi:NPCBM/NEW2 domain-containing protein [Actinoplanes sp. NPDC049668]|uniref:NPCBM/NEW2 domain-containing protein n=1 Tax=unclassified Actinoplanes TaxID=2626549 RepID=UPI0033BF9B59
MKGNTAAATALGVILTALTGVIGVLALGRDIADCTLNGCGENKRPPTAAVATPPPTSNGPAISETSSAPTTAPSSPDAPEPPEGENVDDPPPGTGETPPGNESPYLADLEAVTSNSFKKGPVGLADKTLLHSLTRNINNCTTDGTASYALGGRYAKMTGQFGLSDRTPRADARIALEIQGDGKALKSFEFTLNDGAVPATIDVQDVSRLELHWTYVNPQLCVSARPVAQLVIGDAKLAAK